MISLEKPQMYLHGFFEYHGGSIGWGYIGQEGKRLVRISDYAENHDFC